MAIGKLIRLNRLFADSSGRLCSIAVDHLMGYSEGLPKGLRQIQPTLAAIAAARPDAVTMHEGMAITLIMRGRYDEAAVEASAAMQIAQDLENAKSVCDAQNLLGRALEGAGRFEEALAGLLDSTAPRRRARS